MLNQVLVVAVGLMGLAANVASGQQNYPAKPIRIVTAEAGGGNDVLARVIAQGISGPLGQQVIVENRPTGLTQDIVARATPDGYTVLLSGSTLWLSPLMRDYVPYDVVRDFSPVTLVTTSPLVLIVPPSSPANSVKELIALARNKPGMLNFATGPTGTASHLAPELFKAMAGINIVRVPYKGAGPGVNALMAGEVQLMIANAGSGMPYVKSGRLKALAVTSAQPSALVPGLPTVAATLPGYEYAVVQGLFAPAKTPAVIIKRLNQEIVRVLHSADVKERISSTGVEAVGSSPDELAARIKSETVRLGKVIKDVGIREE